MSYVLYVCDFRAYVLHDVYAEMYAHVHFMYAYDLMYAYVLCVRVHVGVPVPYVLSYCLLRLSLCRLSTFLP